jgi:hypothetical protein
MIIKSMTRKHASFSQLIDYIERGMGRNNTFSVHFNTYSRDSEELKAEFSENAERLKFRKNGVYLYHEVISIKRTHRISEDQQKEALQKIVAEYLKRRASKQLAYAVLHSDKADNLHFHLVISANDAGDSQRKRLSKSDFSSIQIQLEKWTMETFPNLEQKAVFSPNQTDQEKQERQQKARISNDGAEIKRRGGKTSERDGMKETIEGIFSTATNGRNFTDLMEKAGLKLYQRGKNYGVTDQNGTKYRFSTLGLAEAWENLDKRMLATLHRGAETVQDTVRQTAETVLGQHETTAKPRQEAKNEERPTEAKTPEDTSQDTTKTAEEQHQDTQAPDPITEEAERRRLEMETIRAKRASTKTSHRLKPT